VAPDKFKGTLSAREAARSIAEGVRASVPRAEIVDVPVADGGEGFLSSLLARGGESHHVTVRGPDGAPVQALVGYLDEGRVVLESAQACGLSLVSRTDPLGSSSAGVGDLILHAITDHSPKKIVVGIGGTASTDGGTGAATALGWRFLDAAGEDLRPGGGALPRLHAIDGTGVDVRIAGVPIVAACDVVNPLVGARGSAAVFGPQKGATREQVDVLAHGLARLAAVVHRDLGVDVSRLPHGGAGGGLAAGLAAFAGAELTPGFGYVASECDLPAEIARADLVVTGEGRFDATTGEGKVVSGVMDLGTRAGVRTVVVAGEVAPDASAPGGVQVVSLAERFGAGAVKSAAAALTTTVAEVLAADPRR
jgi:glycerate kinase